MEERYNLEGSARQTDEFMKPLIIDDSGVIRGSTVSNFRGGGGGGGGGEWQSLVMGWICVCEVHSRNLDSLCGG